jgi:hypothetical protein
MFPLDICGHGSDASTVHVVPQELKRGSAKVALARVDNHTMVTETLKNQSQVLLMILGTRIGYQEVIHVSVDKVQTSEHFKYEALERLSCIPEAEWQSQEFKQTKR